MTLESTLIVAYEMGSKVASPLLAPHTFKKDLKGLERTDMRNVYLIVAFAKDDLGKDVEYVRTFSEYTKARDALELLKSDDSFYWCMLLDTSSKTEIYG